MVTAVLCNKAQGLAFATPADKNRGPVDRLRRTQRLGQLVMLAFEWSVVVRIPHLRADLQSLLESFEAFADRREGHAKATMLTLEKMPPRRPGLPGRRRARRE